jgi:hypothetical protein
VAEVYGELAIGFQYPRLMIGELDGGPCEAPWAGSDATGRCRKTVTSGTTHNFWETPICYSDTALRTDCEGSGSAWFHFSNELYTSVLPGEDIELSVEFFDYDPTIFDPDDLICDPHDPGSPFATVKGFTLAQLYTLKQSYLLSYNNPGDGGCTVQVTISRAF